MQTQDIDKVSSKLKDVFSRNSKIVAGYLFGSFLHGHIHKGSDIDIAILIHPSEIKNYTLDDQLDLEVEITLQLKTENFDLIILNRAPLILQFRIISTGRLIYIKDDDVRCDFEEKIMSSYYDFLPRLQEFNKEYFSALKERYLK